MTTPTASVKIRTCTTDHGNKFTQTTIEALFPLIEGRPFDDLYSTGPKRVLKVNTTLGEYIGYVSFGPYGLSVMHPGPHDDRVMAFTPFQVRSVEQCWGKSR